MAITATIGGAILLVPLSVVPPVPLGGVEIITGAAEVVENPPKTWDKYLKEGKIADIIRMEGKEFMTAIEKAESVEHFLKEATHTLAAVMLFCAEK